MPVCKPEKFSRIPEKSLTMQNQIIYTTGYTGENFEALKLLVEFLDAVLVD